MKLRKLIFIPICLLLIASNFASCGVDRWPEYAEQTGKDIWIDSVMRQNYLWNYTIPESKYLNFFTAPTTFLQSILYKAEDNSLSKVDTFYKTPPPSYGFNYILQKSASNDTAYYALVSYTLPNSPASDAGLKRGDWITQVNNQILVQNNAAKLLSSGEALDLLVGEYETIPATDTTSASWTVKESANIEMSAMRSVAENPINYYSVINTTSGIKLGYLVYNQFIAGSESDPDVYNKELLEISNYFYKEGVTHFALDLRYNKGGNFDCTHLLASLFAPTSALGSNYASLTYNSEKSYKDATWTYNQELISGGSNLNISQGFVITSSQTSASVTGVFLNCLSPLKRWGLVGASVSCWGMAAEQYVNPYYSWSVSPIVCYVANSEGETGQSGSFTPTVSIAENSDLANFLPFGNIQETLLKAVIELIDGN